MKSSLLVRNSVSRRMRIIKLEQSLDKRLETFIIIQLRFQILNLIIILRTHFYSNIINSRLKFVNNKQIND